MAGRKQCKYWQIKERNAQKQKYASLVINTPSFHVKGQHKQHYRDNGKEQGSQYREKKGQARSKIVWAMTRMQQERKCKKIVPSPSPSFYHATKLTSNFSLILINRVHLQGNPIITPVLF